METAASATPSQRVAVIGGGITGLAAAHRLVELQPNVAVTLFEAAPRLGGVLETVHRDGYLVEAGADNWITNVPWATDLCNRIGFANQLVETNSTHRGAFVVRRGKLRKIPPGFIVMAPSRIWPVITTQILSPWGKLRLACESFVSKRTEEDDESLASFVTRRLGRETYDRLVQPLIGGIYTGDPELLSLRSTMRRFQDMEREHGSLTRAIRSQNKDRSTAIDGGARYSMFMAPRDGLSSLIDAIAARLQADSVRLCSTVTQLFRSGSHWSVQTTNNAAAAEPFNAVILAASARGTARLLSELDSQLADELGAIPHASCSIVSLGYRRDQITHPLDGFGFVVPRIEKRRILSASFSSVKYPGRAPDGHVLVRVFVGGAFQPELAALPDDALQQIATTDLRDLLGIRGEPRLVEISRRPSAMPQYYVGHEARVDRIEGLMDQHPGLQLAGNAFNGVGMPHCIHSGQQAAERALAEMKPIAHGRVC
ncbi:MAG TPA: protoporphyrinogen oxidase [Pirellulaceae bacterium]|nr:protoporphyrinogen oxidase [Pirellulaceae bacterium]